MKREKKKYDAKVFKVPLHSTKQLMPTVWACIKEMRHYWDKPFRHRVPFIGYCDLEMINSDTVGLCNPLVVEQAVAYRLHPSNHSTLAIAGPSLPSTMNRFMHYNVYKPNPIRI